MKSTTMAAQGTAYECVHVVEERGNHGTSISLQDKLSDVTDQQHLPNQS